MKTIISITGLTVLAFFIQIDCALSQDLIAQGAGIHEDGQAGEVYAFLDQRKGDESMVRAEATSRETSVAADYLSLWQDILQSFELQAANGQVHLAWSTLFEVNNDFFTLEKSVDGQLWETVGQLDGAGCSTMPRDYVLSDVSPFMGVSYYRLTQTDFNGEERMIHVQALTFSGDVEIMVYPNPTADRISIFSTQLELGEIHVCNANGEQVMDKISVLDKNQSHVELDLSTLPRGEYLVKVGSAIRKINKL